jgi:hypothetical protein
VIRVGKFPEAANWSNEFGKISTRYSSVHTHLLLSRLSRSFERLFDHDGGLFETGIGGVHEQTVTHRLGIYLQDEFPGFHVDCEYNRRGNDLKKRRAGGRLMKPDVVVHHREGREFNFLVIEAKKLLQWSAHFKDLSAKMCDLTNPEGLYGYQLGLCWDVAGSRNRASHQAFWFSKGKFVLETPLNRFQGLVLANLDELSH